MPEKKNQHLVPACYLRNFEADVSEKQRKNPRFASGVYVNNNKLTDKWKLKSVTHKSFTKSYFYNLPEDDPRQPLIENYLSTVEADYGKYIKQILAGEANNENISFLSYFVTIQFMRVEKFINMFQGAWDKVAGWADTFEGKENYKNALKNISKRQLAMLDLGHIIHPYAAIIYNETNFPFITSDNPVVRRQINIVDALQIVPRRHLPENISESAEFAFIFLPLSPKVAYVSCELINHSGSLFYTSNDLEVIFYLNYFSIVNSHEKVYSSIIEPIKGEKDLAKHLTEKSQTIVKIYTTTKRLISSGSMTNNSHFEISLKLEDLNQVKHIRDGEQIQFVEVVEDGHSIRGMRDCKISSIDYTNGLITIKSNIQFCI